MKTLIVYYSRTGNTRKVAGDLASALGADVEEIVDLKDRSGALGWLRAGKDATFKRKTSIQPSARDPDQYDLVVVGTPVWAFTMAPAVRTWLGDNAPKIRQVAFFCTMGGSGDKRTLENMQALSGRKPLATAVMIDKDIKAGRHADAVRNFAAQLRGTG